MFQMKRRPKFQWPELKGKTLNATEMANYFLDIHKGWFAETTNTMYNKREQCMKALRHFMRYGTELKDADHNQIYVVNKFDAEFFRDFERV